jgi:hypothetical protein
MTAAGPPDITGLLESLAAIADLYATSPVYKF